MKVNTLRASVVVLVCVFALTAVTAGAGNKGDARPEKILYTTQNLWFEKPTNLWCINYKAGEIIPAGTQVSDVAINKAKTGKRAGGLDKAISFVRVEDGTRFWVNFAPKFHPGKSIHDYMQYLFSEKDFETLTEGLTDAEVEAVQRGAVVEGMSKRAVLMAYGLPPEHKTPSLNDNRWYYWSNRFRSKTICFDDNDKAIACEKLKLEGQL